MRDEPGRGGTGAFVDSHGWAAVPGRRGEAGAGDTFGNGVSALFSFGRVKDFSPGGVEEHAFVAGIHGIPGIHLDRCQAAAAGECFSARPEPTETDFGHTGRDGHVGQAAATGERNALLPMTVTPSGIVTDVRPTQPENAPSRWR